MRVVTHIIDKPIGEVKPYFRNPRINHRTIDALVQAIPLAGFNVPIVIDSDGIIVKGHARYAAAIRLGMETIPCVVSEADEEAIRLDRLADNRIAEYSAWDNAKLEAELKTIGIDLSFLDLKDPEIAPMANERPGVGAEVGGEAIVPQGATSQGIDTFIKLVCDKCGETSFIHSRDVKMGATDDKTDTNNNPGDTE